MLSLVEDSELPDGCLADVCAAINEQLTGRAGPGRAGHFSVWDYYTKPWRAHASLFKSYKDFMVCRGVQLFRLVSLLFVVRSRPAVVCAHTAPPPKKKKTNICPTCASQAGARLHA